MPKLDFNNAEQQILNTAGDAIHTVEKKFEPINNVSNSNAQSNNLFGNTNGSSTNSNAQSNSMGGMVRTIGSRSGFTGQKPTASIDSQNHSASGVYNYNNVSYNDSGISNNSGNSFVLAFSVTIALVALVAIIALCVVNFVYKI